MTTTHQPPAVGSDGPSPPATSGAADDQASPLRRELGLTMELVALAAFAFSRPVLSTFGDAPEAFIVRGAGRWAVVGFALVVALVPASAVAAVGLGVRRVRGRARPWAQPALVGVLGGIAVWRLGQEVTGWPPDATKLLMLGPLAGAALVALRHRLPSSGTFLRYAGASSVVFLVQFLVASPSASLVFGDGPHLDDDVVRAVGAQLGDDPPNVLFVVFDALPLESLLDGTGHIDGELYPNFAALAGESTWYRNNTSVSAFTLDAVPALLTGRYPSTNASIRSDGGDRENLFTLLGGSYTLHVEEQITRECPTELCPETSPGGLTPLLGDAVDLWAQGVASDAGDTDFDLPGLAASRVYDDAEDWIDGLELEPGGRPDLVFHHVILPHEPWRTLDDGTIYDGGNPPTGYYVNGWTNSGLEVGRQRHVLQLQAADRLLGKHLDTLRDAGMYDDSLVVVTADHGAAFVPDTLSRGLTATNFEQIMWTPLLVKAPQQQAADIDDSDVRATDVLPTIAHMLGVDLPWSVDGEPVDDGTDRDGVTKPFDDHKLNRLRSEDGADLLDITVGDALERVLTADAVEWTGFDAVWKRTEHGDLFGRRVEDLAVDEPAEAAIAVTGLDHLEDIALDDPLPIEVVGRTSMEPGTYVAYALNGTIGAVSVVEPGAGPGARLVNGIVPPSLFVEGRNELVAYVIRGAPGAETLEPLRIIGG